MLDERLNQGLEVFVQQIQAIVPVVRNESVLPTLKTETGDSYVEEMAAYYRSAIVVFSHPFVAELIRNYGEMVGHLVPDLRKIATTSQPVESIVLDYTQAPFNLALLRSVSGINPLSADSISHWRQQVREAMASDAVAEDEWRVRPDPVVESHTAHIWRPLVPADFLDNRKRDAFVHQSARALESARKAKLVAITGTYDEEVICKMSQGLSQANAILAETFMIFAR